MAHTMSPLRRNGAGRERDESIAIIETEGAQQESREAGEVETGAEDDRGGYSV
jgi:hypothetical protein